jgi:hypothetical protein
VVPVGHGQGAADQPQDRVAVGVDLVVAGAGHLDAREHQEGPEDIDGDMEALQQAGPGGDEAGAEHQRAEHAVEQHSVPVLAGDGEVGEQQGEDEDVVDGQALFDQEPGQVLPGGGGALPGPEQAGERQAEGDPDRRPDGRLAGRYDVSVAVRDQVDRQHDQDEGDERRPGPQGHVHVQDLLLELGYEPKVSPPWTGWAGAPGLVAEVTVTPWGYSPPVKLEY